MSGVALHAGLHNIALRFYSLCPSINGLFAQSLRYVQKIILRISNICLWLFFSHALILNKNPQLWMDTSLIFCFIDCNETLD